MLRGIFIIYLIFINIFPVYSIDTDSLEFEISSTNNKRRKTDLLILLGKTYLQVEPGKVIEKSYGAAALAESIGYEEGLALAHINIADYYNNENKEDSALNHFNISLSILRGLTNDALTAETLYKIGSIFFNSSNYKAALQYTNEALLLFEIVEDRKQLAATHSLLCNIKSYIVGFR